MRGSEMAIPDESKAHVLASIRLMVRLSEQYLRSQRKREEPPVQPSSDCVAEWTGDDSYFLRGDSRQSDPLHHRHHRSRNSKRRRKNSSSGSSSSSSSGMNQIPDELLIAIFASIHSARDRSSCASVCKRWLILQTHMQRQDFQQVVQQADETDDSVSSVNQVNQVGSVNEVARLEKQPLWAMGDLSRCLEGNKANDIRLASMAVGTAARGGLGRLTIRGDRSSSSSSSSSLVTDLGLTAIGICCGCLRSLTLWDCSGITDQSLHTIGHNCRLLESLELLRCPGITDSGLRTVAAGCLRLTNFSVESCDGVGDEGIVSLAESCSNLLTVTIIRCPGIGDPAVVAIVEHCRTLKKLKLEKIGVTDRGLAFLAGHCKAITKLVLSGLENLTSEGFATLIVPEALKFLKVLVLNGCPGVTDSFLSGFGSVCHELYRLCLIDCENVLDEGLEAFVSGYQSLKGLQIERCSGITYTGLACVLRSSNRTLKSLHVSNCSGVRDSTLVEDPAPFLCSSVKSFSMTHSVGVGDKCVELAGRMFPGLQHLDLSGMVELTDAGLSCFLSCSGGALLSLNLSGCSEVTDEGIVAVAGKCWELQTVVLEGCGKVTDKGVGYLASQCRSLQELDVSRCCITDDGIIAVVISVGPALKTLSLSGCERITDESLPTIQRMCDSLAALNLKNCSRLSSGALEKFESELGNRCDILLP